MWTNGPRRSDRLGRDMESPCLPGYCSDFEDCDAYSILVPDWQHIRRTPKGREAASDGLSTLALFGAQGQTLTAGAQAGAGFVDEERRDLGWVLAAEIEVEAEAAFQVLAVTMVGLIAEAGRDQVEQECNWVNRKTITLLDIYFECSCSSVVF